MLNLLPSLFYNTKLFYKIQRCRPLENKSFYRTLFSNKTSDGHKNGLIYGKKSSKHNLHINSYIFIHTNNTTEEYFNTRIIVISGKMRHVTPSQ